MSLHTLIMRLSPDPYIETLPDNIRVAYKNGYNAARFSAYEICLEAETIMTAMNEALEDLRQEVIESGNWGAEDFGWPAANKKTDEVTRRYKRFKERKQ